MFGIFGDTFDLNGDGKLDSLESAMDYALFSDLMESEVTAIRDAGISFSEFENMDDEEKREALEDAGLDPDDYDL